MKIQWLDRVGVYLQAEDNLDLIALGAIGERASLKTDTFDGKTSLAIPSEKLLAILKQWRPQR